MAKEAKKGKGKARVVAKREKPKPLTKPKAQPPDLATLRKPVLAAKGGLTKAEAEAKDLIEKGQALVVQSRSAYREAVAAYREACRKLGVRCEFPGGRSTNVSPKVSIEIIERNKDGFTLMVKGMPKTRELIPMSELKKSVNKAAYAYTDKHLGPREHVGNKGGYVDRCSYVVSVSFIFGAPEEWVVTQESQNSFR